MTGEEFAKATVSKSKGELGPVIIDALKRYASQHGLSTGELVVLIGQTKYDSLNGCPFFVRNGMYHGIEKDGHIHT